MAGAPLSNVMNLFASGASSALAQQWYQCYSMNRVGSVESTTWRNNYGSPKTFLDTVHLNICFLVHLC